MQQGGIPVRLGGKTFDTLTFLARNHGRAISKDELLKNVWVDVSVSKNTVEQAIREIRRALNEDRVHPRYLLTIPGRSYQWTIPVRDCSLDNSITEHGPQPLPTHTPIPKRGWFLIGGALALAGILGVLAWNLRRPMRVAGQITQITHTVHPKASPVVLAGNRLFFNESEGGRYYIAEIGADGTGHARPLDLQIENPVVCAASPDGRQLLVRSALGRFAENGPMWIVPLDGAAPYLFGDVKAFDGAWSPDGRQIALAGDHDVALYSPDAVKLRRIVSVPDYPWWPRWAPDGKSLRLSIMDAKTQLHSIWEVGADGTRLRPVNMQSGRVSVCCGSWTPDGHYFVFPIQYPGRLCNRCPSRVRLAPRL